MSDEMRPYPPTERRLGRLWAAGVTPASPALVGLAVLASACAAGAALWPVLLGWSADLVVAGLSLAARPEEALAAARPLALPAAAVAAGISLLALAAALGAQLLQAGPRPSGPVHSGIKPPSLGAGSRLSLSATDLVRGLLVSALAAVGVAAAVRAVLGQAEELAVRGPLLDSATGLLTVVVWPLLGLAAAAAALDAVVRRASWARWAWLSRRELEDELRESEGHLLTRRRRRRSRRRRHV